MAKLIMICSGKEIVFTSVETSEKKKTMRTPKTMNKAALAETSLTAISISQIPILEKEAGRRVAK